MRTSIGLGLSGLLALGACLGCGSKSIEDDAPFAEPGAGGEGAGSEPDAATIEITARPDARSFIELATPAAVDLDGDGSRSLAWDLAIQGRDVLTNGGISGPGNSRAFGPLSAPTFLSDTAPEVPLLIEDRAGGAFIDWYDYGGDTHQLYSRYHVYALRDGERYFKLQILSYYGERLGTPMPALFQVRYAEIFADRVGETRVLSNVDATAGGSTGDDVTQPSACVDLDDDEPAPLLPDDAARVDTWQLCFRREGVAVNGGLSGPRGVEAVDLQAAETASETEAEIQRRTAESELARFDAVDHAVVTDPALDYRQDGVVTAFGARWLEAGSDPLAVSDAVWLVYGASGAAKYLLQFRDLAGDPAEGEAIIKLRAKAVR